MDKTRSLAFERKMQEREADMSSLKTTASWVIRRWDTKEVVMETFSRRTAEAIRPEFEAVPILEYLQSLNRRS